MTSKSETYISETLRQGKKFKKYQGKIIKREGKHIDETLLEGFAGRNMESRQLVDEIAQAKSASADLTNLQTAFESTLERYKTAHTQLMTTTTNFLSDNNKIQNNSILGKNIYVNTIVSNPASDSIGVYNGNPNTPAMSALNGNYTYEQCQDSAIKNGSQYFALSEVDSTGKTGKCSISKDLNSVIKYGKNIPKCVSGNDGKIYGNNMVNALYSLTGSTANYVGCYNDNGSSRAMTSSGPSLSSLPNVYLTGAYNTGPWGCWDFVDKNAQWIWYTPNAAGNAPNNTGAPITLISKFNYTGTGYARATIYGICDNTSTVYLNGTNVGKIEGGWGWGWGGNGRGIAISVSIQPGLNYICAEVTNWGGPAGFILSILDSNNRVLFNTTTSWKYSQVGAKNLIPNKQDYSVDSCKQYAAANGYQYFALQGGGVGTSQCYVSNNLQEAQKYGSAESTKIGQDDKLYGRSLANATYKVKNLGHADYLGKLGYVDNNGNVTEYPKSMISMVNNVPTIVNSNKSCGKDIVNVDSNVWASQKMSTRKMTPNTKCGLSSAIQADQASAEDLAAQLQTMSSQIISIINTLENLDASVIAQMGINKSALDEMLKKYTAYNREFSQYKNSDYGNYENILSDSGIVASQQNYSYLLWSSIALVVLIITLQILRKNG